jgi:mannosyltransferase
LPIVHWSLYVVSAALTLYAHNLGAPVLLALNLLAVTRRRWWRHLPRLLLADLLALILFGPWLVAVLPGQVGFVGRGYWLTPPGPAELLRAVMQPVLTLYEPAPMWVLTVGLFGGLLLLALLVLRAWRTRSRAGWFLLLWAMPIATLLLLSLWRPLFLERALLPSALFYLVATGWLLARGGLPRLLRYGLATLLTAAMIGSLVTHYTYAGFPRPPFAAVADYLHEHVGPDDVVVHTNKLTYFPLYTYAPELPAAFLADRPGSPQDTLAYPTQQALGLFASQTITAAVGPAERVWLIYFPREVEERGGAHPAMTWLEAHFVLVRQQPFSDLVVALYRRERP